MERAKSGGDNQQAEKESCLKGAAAPGTEAAPIFGLKSDRRFGWVLHAFFLRI
jgi:hypothetical protein